MESFVIEKKHVSKLMAFLEFLDYQKFDPWNKFNQFRFEKAVKNGNF